MQLLNYIFSWDNPSKELFKRVIPPTFVLLLCRKFKTTSTKNLLLKNSKQPIINFYVNNTKS